MGIGSAVHERPTSAVTRAERSPGREFIPRHWGRASIFFPPKLGPDTNVPAPTIKAEVDVSGVSGRRASRRRAGGRQEARQLPARTAPNRGPTRALKLAVTCAVTVMTTLPCGIGPPEATTIVAAAMKLNCVPGSRA
jgi:hypothetical protein